MPCRVPKCQFGLLTEPRRAFPHPQHQSTPFPFCMEAEWCVTSSGLSVNVPRAGTSHRHLGRGLPEPRTCDGAAMEKEGRRQPTPLPQESPCSVPQPAQYLSFHNSWLQHVITACSNLVSVLYPGSQEKKKPSSMEGSRCQKN